MCIGGVLYDEVMLPWTASSCLFGTGCRTVLPQLPAVPDPCADAVGGSVESGAADRSRILQLLCEFRAGVW